MKRSKKRINNIVNCLHDIGVRVAWNNGYAYHAFYGDCIFIVFVDQESRFCVTIREYDNKQFSENGDTFDIDNYFGKLDYIDYEDENIHPIFNTSSAHSFAYGIQKHLKDWEAINDPLYLACQKAIKEEKQFAKSGFFGIIRKKLLEEA
jgi:hypothetical protein